MLALIAQGGALGFSAGAMPGPFISYLVGVALASGWRRALWLVLVPLVADIPIIFVSVFILRQVPPAFIAIIQVAGGLYLLWIAYGTWKQYRAGTGFEVQASADAGTGRVFAQGVLMNWLGPGPYIFWSSILGPLLVGALEQSVGLAVAFLLSFYVPFIALLTAYVVVFDRLRRLNARTVRLITLGVLVVLVVFAIQLIGQGIGLL